MDGRDERAGPVPRYGGGPGSGPAAPPGAATPVVPVVAPEGVRRCRAAVAGAARGERLLLHVRLRPAGAAGGASGPGPSAALNLAVLAAVAFAYAAGRPVTTLLDPDEPEDAASADAYWNALALSHLSSPVGRHDQVIQTQRRMGRLGALGTVDSPHRAFLLRLAGALAFARSHGADALAIGAAVRSDICVAWPHAVAARPGFVVTERGDARRYSVLSHVVRVPERTTGVRGDAGARATGPGELANPVLLRLTPGLSPERVARRCADLDPLRALGKLVVIVDPSHDDQWLAEVARAVYAEGHRPAWTVVCPASSPDSDRLRLCCEALARHRHVLAGVSMDLRGRQLERVLRTGWVLSEQRLVRP